MTDEKPTTPAEPTAPSPAAAGEPSREERIAAAKARAEALKAQRAAAPAPAAGAAPTVPPAPSGGVKPLVASRNPGGAPVVAPQHSEIRAFGTLTQAVEFTCDASEDANLAKILGGLGLYKNPLRGAWQVDYRYYAEAVRRLQAAGYRVDGTDYLGRPLSQWVAEDRGWTRRA
ncbi:MAG TPA: hypothetical protein VK587_08915 [bacterium]|nr:hypothetical protein [bacterium]